MKIVVIARQEARVKKFSGILRFFTQFGFIETRKSSSLPFIRGGLGRGKTFDTAIMNFQTPSHGTAGIDEFCLCSCELYSPIQAENQQLSS
ncbi:hypothetical protein [Aphanizomenon flos-aquae]|uniref:hypothetical protein n=1 Tax=Aphanizomenon flos-aquae TaxID=1176 RepID=UPI00190F3A0B|nr:hypothetical protein [Aphanizomenon flos-aquae]